MRPATTSLPRVLPGSLWIALAALGVLLSASNVSGPFTIDESNYLVSVLALRDGGLSLRNTTGLPPSPELRYFDPHLMPGVADATPVASTAPPLYAVLAWPFSFLGWRGLVLINTLAYLATIGIAFAYARRFSTSAQAPWIAAVAVAFGSYFLEYAQGMWPHMLSMALVAGAALLLARALEEPSPRWAAGAGLVAALAAGVRYQNAFVLVCFALALVLLARYRVRATLALCAGAAFPLAASSWMNHVRSGSWNPISKGVGYLPSSVAALVGAPVAPGDAHPLRDALTMAWARVVDYTARPPLGGTLAESVLAPDPRSGAYLVVTAVKKAWLQSAPWMLLPLLVLVLAWLPASGFRRVSETAPQRQIRFVSLVVVLSIGMFSSRGILNTSGLCFNQRYFCELVPLVALVFAWSIQEIAPRSTPLLAGGLAGTLFAFLALQPDPTDALRHRLLMLTPLGLALVLVAAWAWTRSDRARPLASATLLTAIGAAFAWALAVHVGDDLAASRTVRGWRETRLREIAPALPQRAAIFASSAAKDALGPLQFDRDVVIVAPDRDDAATARTLIDALSAQGRRVFLLPGAISKHRASEVLAGKHLRYLGEPSRLFEVR